MLHRLALALGRTVGEIERGMSVSELRDWQRYCAFHPLPFELDDIHSGQLLALLVNINRAKDTPMVNAIDYMILAKKTEPEAATLTIAQRMKAVTTGGG